MLHADLLTVTQDGIRIPETALKQLGIYDGSACWGVWYQRMGAADDRQRHLIISAIHPRSWPFLMRVRIYLKDEPGALEQACQFLDDNNLSILLGECTEAGFENAQLNIVAESTHEDLCELKSRKDKFDREHPWIRQSDKDVRVARWLATEISTRMFIHLRQVDRNLENARIPIFRWTEHSEYQGDASASPVDTGVLMQRLARRKDLFANVGEVKSVLRVNVMPPYSVRYMHRTLRFSTFGGGSDAPIAFRYDSRSALLRLDRPEAFASDEAPWRSLPCPAVVVFHTRDKYLRIDPAVPEDSHKRLTRVAVDYSVNSPRNGSPAKDSKGLLWRVCRTFAGEPPLSPGAAGGSTDPGSPKPPPPHLMNLRDMSLKWTRHSGTRRSGRITFIGDASPADYGRIKERLNATNHCHPSPLPRTSIQNVKIHEYPTARLFVSLHFGHPREACLREIIQDVARECGLEAGAVQTHTHPATGLVVDSIRESKAFLQLLSFRSNEEPESVNFTWLDFEYGVALGLGIPTMRLVDVVRRPYEWWGHHITTNPDQRVKDFRTDVSDAELRAKVREALTELAAKLAPPSDGKGM